MQIVRVTKIVSISFLPFLFKLHLHQLFVIEHHVRVPRTKTLQEQSTIVIIADCPTISISTILNHILFLLLIAAHIYNTFLLYAHDTVALPTLHNAAVPCLHVHVKRSQLGQVVILVGNQVVVLVELPGGRILIVKLELVIGSLEGVHMGE